MHVHRSPVGVRTTRRPTRGAFALTLALALLGADAMAQDGAWAGRSDQNLSVRERDYAEALQRSLGAGEARGVARATADGTGTAARGVRYRADDLSVERLRFRDAAQARAYADHLRAQGGDTPRVVEVRGNQVLHASGPRLRDEAAASRARESGWDVLPAPESAPAAGGAGAAAGQGAGQAAGQGQRGSVNGARDQLAHHLNGEALRPATPAAPAAPVVPGDDRPAVDRALANETTQGVVGAHQRTRVRPAYDALSAADQRRFTQLLDGAENDAQRAYLLKGLAAGNNVDDLTTFARNVRGHDAAWLDRNARLSGDQGVRQQYHDTCGVTTVQALRGEYDPVYALNTRRGNDDVHDVDNSDGERVNPNLAREQRTSTETPYAGTTHGAHTGRAVARDAAGGKGRWVDDKLNQLTARTGLTYATRKDPTPQQAADILRDRVGQGMQTPIVIGNTAGGYNHYVLVTDTRVAEGRGREYRIHNPWDGRTTWVREQQILNRTMGVGSYNRINAIEVPSVAPRAPRGDS
jgi:hypothetical protein